MRKLLYIICLLCIYVAASSAQAHIILPDSTQITSDPDSLDMLPPAVPSPQVPKQASPPDSINPITSISSWRIDPRTGDHIPAVMDTLLFNFQHRTLPDSYSVAMGFLGPLGSPSISKLFLDREETDNFVFNNAYSPYLADPTKQVFLNTRVPYARLNYQSGGGDQTKEERFLAELSMNFGKNLNVGLEGDIISSKGYYNSQAVKSNNWKLYSSYVTDRIELHAFLNSGSITNFENGGITDDNFIREPDSVDQSFTSQTIPVKFTKTWNKIKNNQIYVSGRYNLGYTVPTTDTLRSKEFVPVASVVFTSHYKQQYRRFLSYDTAAVAVNGVPMQRIDTFYNNRFYKGAVDDSVRFSSFKNTVALSLREGFRDWVKFGLTAFLEYDLRQYSMIDSTSSGRRFSHRENAVTIGGVLSKQQGENFLFNIRADMGVLGANLGEFRALGTIETGFEIAGKRTTLTAEAYLKNLRPKYLQEHYHSKYYWWDKEWGDTRRVYAGGKLFIPFTNTTFHLGVENIQNYIYFDRDRNITQENGSVQILSARVDQNLHLGVFHWDNQLVYQTSSNEEVIPVPLLSVYSNMYLKTKIVNELTLQFGVDAHYHTSYYAPGYEPALLQFYNQREKQVGNYPIATIYANMHLKQTRFFVMYYNAASTIWKPREYFSLPGYPVNPSIIKLGVSVNLHN